MDEKSEQVSELSTSEDLQKRLDSLKNQSITTLSITRCKFDYSRIGTLNEGFSALETLCIYDNETENLKNGNFFKSDNLRHLQLNKNALQGLGTRPFISIPCLFSLEIIGNRIERLECNIFEGLVNLGHLILRSNGLQCLEKRAFHGLRGLFSLELSYNDLEAFENGIFDDLVNLGHLIVKHNKLKLLNCELFRKLDRLCHLDLSSNKLTHLPEGLFVNSTIGGYGLNFANNLIEEIQVGAFKELCIPVGRLVLCNNRLKALKEDTFTKITANKLDLSNNLVNTLETGVFQDCSFSSLHLERNGLTNLNSDTFKDLKVSDELCLSHNKLRTYSAAFQGCKDLRKLILDHNLIIELPSNGFSGLENLHYLSIMGNKINKIDKEAFKGLHALHSLWLAENQIKVLDGDWFEHIKTVRCLRFDYNHLSNLSEDVFRHLSNIISLSLNNNKLIEAPSSSIFALIDGNGEVNLDNNQITFLSTRVSCSSSPEEGKKIEFQYLSMQCNEISRIERRAFDGFVVSNLLLGGNRIRELEPGALEGLTIKNDVILDGNLIEKIDVLREIPKCRAVRLADNKINGRQVCVDDSIEHVEIVSFEEHSYRRSNGKWEFVHGIL